MDSLRKRCRLRILLLTEGDWYNDIVEELRTDNVVFVVKPGNRLSLRDGTLSLPKLLGRQKAYTWLARIISHALLLARRYDICMVDYRSARMPRVMLWIKRIGIWKTAPQFVYDVRTIPVGYTHANAARIESRFRSDLRFVMKYFQGITFITEEMKRHVSSTICDVSLPSGVWESGVLTDRFFPQPINIELRQALGLSRDDFVCFYHGAIAHRRGVRELVEAFERIQLTKRPIRLVILSRQELILPLLLEYKVGQSVVPADWVPPDQVADLIAISDLCIVPLPNIAWWRVSSPLKLMEYIACGKPILLTRILAHVKVVGHTQNYFWIDDARPSEISDAILRAEAAFREDPVAYRTRGMNERKRHIKSITWECRAESLKAFLRSIHTTRVQASLD